jgi:hypothetical protein
MAIEIGILEMVGLPSPAEKGGDIVDINIPILLTGLGRSVD